MASYTLRNTTRTIEMSSTLQPRRKRDQLRAIFGRSPSPLPVHRTAGPAQTATSRPTLRRIASRILADALETLAPDDCETIKVLLRSTNVVSAGDAFDEVHARATQLQQDLECKRLSWNYKGRQVYLFEQADKVVRLLDKFKAVGDVIASVDPIHIGLPWAGVRAILEVRIDW